MTNGWMLDTNAVIALVAGKSEALMQWVSALDPAQLTVSSVVAHELYYGAYRSQRSEHNLETLRLLFSDIEILEFEAEDARVAGSIRADLARQGAPIGPYDVLIAGQALARGRVLVTQNTSEFSRVAGLRIEDWAAV